MTYLFIAGLILLFIYSFKTSSSTSSPAITQQPPPKKIETEEEIAAREERLRIRTEKQALQDKYHKLTDKASRLEGKGEYEKAIAIYEEVITMSMANPAYLRHLAGLIKLKGDTTRAIELLEDFLEKEVNPDAEKYRRIGEWCEEAGDIEKAVDYFKIALDLNPRVGIKKKYEKLSGKKFVDTSSKIIINERAKPMHQDRELHYQMWCKKIMDNKEDYLILDSETTGLGGDDVIIELAIIDLDGKRLFNSRLKPIHFKEIPKGASDIHGITMDKLKDCPTFKEVSPQLIDIVANKTVLIYNASYDVKMLYNNIRIERVQLFRMRAECVMLEYSRYVGDWSDYRGDYKYQKLPSGDHSAIGDCRATLRLIEDYAR